MNIKRILLLAAGTRIATEGQGLITRTRTMQRSIRALLTPGCILAIWLPQCAQGEVTLTTLYSFRGPEGANPVNGLVQGGDGSFYGATQYGGIGYAGRSSSGNGTVFRLAADGTVTNLYRFAGTANGVLQAGLVQDAAGNLYGTTYGGGANNWGTIFEITPSGTFSVLASLDSQTGDAQSVLTPASDGKFYTTGDLGGASGLGTVFSVATNGALSVLASFDGVRGFTGWYGDALIQGADGNFYGTTQLGGPAFTGVYIGNDGYGTAFKMAPDGTLTNLFVFDGTNGYAPTALVQAPDGNLYGTTGQGGPGFRGTTSGGSGGYGTVFKLSTNGVFTTLALFNGTNGSSPLSLMQARDGAFYGTTDGGGTNGGFGTIFKVTSDGTLTSLFSFNRTNGASPFYSTLVQAADGSFYGTTFSGGASNYGTIFRLSLAPSAPVFQTVARTGSTLSLTWSAEVGRQYQLESVTGLIQTNWSNSGGTITATNSVVAASDSIGPDRQRFYRVALLP